jgi:hypothetical protein
MRAAARFVWCCCDYWEKWDNWKDEAHSIAAASLHDQIRRLRGHPSVFNWMNGSDNPPPAEVEKKYIEIVKDSDWPNPFESSATERPTDVSGKTGVKMTGPYDWVPPNYWLRRIFTRLSCSSKRVARCPTKSSTRFGIREVTSILDERDHRQFRINGKNILIRGAGYTFDMMLRACPPGWATTGAGCRS